MWALKHRPKTIEEFRGNSEVVAELTGWISNWKKEKRKAAMIIGPTGSGKTTLVELIARKMNFNIVETNASDVRSKKALESFFGQSLKQQSLFYKGKLVLFDEVEGISGQEDRGAAGEITKIIESSAHPIILTAIESDSDAVKAIKKVCKVIKFNKVDSNTIVDILKNICAFEGVKFDEKELRAISRLCDGDIRAAINDLEVLSVKGNKTEYGDLKNIGYRDFERSIEDALNIIFMTSEAKISAGAMNELTVPPEDMLEWVRENMPRGYSDLNDIAKAYHFISRADIFRGRIVRQQYYGFMAYESELMSAGVSVSKSRKYLPVTDYHFPTKIAFMARTMFERAKSKSNAAALGPILHCSRYDAKEYFPILKLMKEHQPGKYREISEKTGIDI